MFIRNVKANFYCEAVFIKSIFSKLRIKTENQFGFMVKLSNKNPTLYSVFLKAKTNFVFDKTSENILKNLRPEFIYLT